MEFEEETNCLIVAGNKGEIVFIELNSQNYVECLKGHSGAITFLVLDRNFLFSASEDLSIRVWDAIGRYSLFVFEKAHTSGIRYLFVFDQTG